MNTNGHESDNMARAGLLCDSSVMIKNSMSAILQKDVVETKAIDSIINVEHEQVSPVS